jgi:YD repeat-containing protein
MGVSVQLDSPMPAGLSAGQDTKEARAEAAKQFEALLLGELMKAMRATASFGDEEGDAFARGTYGEMFDQALVESSAGGLGIAQLFERQTAGAAASAPTTRVAAPHGAAAYREAASAIEPSFGRHADKSAPDRDGLTTAFDGGVPTPGLWPVDGGVQSSGYGFRTHPIHGDKRFHAGLDIAAPEGREIRAVQRGTVTYAQRHPGYGNMVEITHPDGIVTRYAHASRLHVRVGDVVDTGEAIADVGSTGQSTGPHLHFEVRDGSRRLDPETYLERLREDAGAGAPTDARPRAGVTTLAREVNGMVLDPESDTP